MTGEARSTKRKAAVRSYRDLTVWAKGMDLVVEVHRLTRKLPKSELYGLSSQLRRAAISIPSNIAEGHARRALGDYLQHLSVARGSLMELETQLLVTERLSYVPGREVRQVLALTDHIGRMLTSLSKALRERQRTVPPLPITDHPSPITSAGTTPLSRHREIEGLSPRT